MIPKIIHYCWLSASDYPDDIKRYMDTWHRLLPDYEFWLWDFNRFPRERSQWVAQAFDARKYAFASDYIRNYALFNHGGIYLDVDVEVLKSFDPLLHLPYFLCRENGSGKIEAAVMGAEPGNPIFGAMLRYYDGRTFCKPDGTYDTITLPVLLSQTIADNGYKIVPVDSIEAFDTDPGNVSVFPYDYFSPIHNVNCRDMTTDRTYAVHRFSGSWLPWYRRLGRKFKELIGPTASEKLTKLIR